MPASTLGPSGPRLFPVPRVTVAPIALRENREKSLRWGRGWRFLVQVIRDCGGEALIARMASRSTGVYDLLIWKGSRQIMRRNEGK